MAAILNLKLAFAFHLLQIPGRFVMGHLATNDRSKSRASHALAVTTQTVQFWLHKRRTAHMTNDST